MTTSSLDLREDFLPDIMDPNFRTTTRKIFSDKLRIENEAGIIMSGLRFSGEFKLKVALDAIKEKYTKGICAKIRPSQKCHWEMRKKTTCRYRIHGVS